MERGKKMERKSECRQTNYESRTAGRPYYTLGTAYTVRYYYSLSNTPTPTHTLTLRSRNSGLMKSRRNMVSGAFSQSAMDLREGGDNDLLTPSQGSHPIGEQHH